MRKAHLHSFGGGRLTFQKPGIDKVEHVDLFLIKVAIVKFSFLRTAVSFLPVDWNGSGPMTNPYVIITVCVLMHGSECW